MPSQPSERTKRIAELVRKGLDDEVIAERVGTTRRNVMLTRHRLGMAAGARVA